MSDVNPIPEGYHTLTPHITVKNTKAALEFYKKAFGGETLFTLYGEMDEVMLGVVGRTVKYVTRIVDADKHVFEIIDLHAGDGYKVVEITYTRKK